MRELEEERKDDPDFTDGSDCDGKVGAVAVMYGKGYSAQISQLKAYLGPSKKHNNYEAEIVGGILALWLLMPETYRKTVFIYSDNQPFIRTAENPKPVLGKYLLQNLYKEANKSWAKLDMKWISGHSKMHGNESADKLAKEAVSGKASRREDLPPILRQTLLSGISLKNRTHMEELKRNWVDMWQGSPQQQQFERIDDTFPFNGYRKRQYELSREHASLLLQIRSGYQPLNSYLHRIKKVDLDKCQACQINPDDETLPETVKHFIYDCDAYIPQRRSLIRAIGATNLPLRDIMMETKHMKELAKYILKTNHFKKE
jgi:ribonuclease HI